MATIRCLVGGVSDLGQGLKLLCFFLTISSSGFGQDQCRCIPDTMCPVIDQKPDGIPATLAPRVMPSKLKAPAAQASPILKSRPQVVVLDGGSAGLSNQSRMQKNLDEINIKLAKLAEDDQAAIAPYKGPFRAKYLGLAGYFQTYGR